MSKKPGRHSLRTYFKLTLGAVILVGLNHVFTKQFDLLYGKFDPVYFTAIAILLIVFSGIFTFIAVVDTSGSLARMMGARDDDE